MSGLISGEHCNYTALKKKGFTRTKFRVSLEGAQEAAKCREALRMWLIAVSPG
jgi:hypothetical protein